MIIILYENKSDVIFVNVSHKFFSGTCSEKITVDYYHTCSEKIVRRHDYRELLRFDTIAVSS